MSKPTHTVATDAIATLGTIIDETAGRDAIHLAVEPIEAGETLFPGQHVGIRDGKAYAGGSPVKALGIVDPFLTVSRVVPGQRFWLIVYPRKITSLRHVWEHPEIDAARPDVLQVDPKAASEAWLREFIAGADCPGYEEVIGAAVGGGDGQWSDEYLHFNGSDAHGEIPAEFWDHLEVVTGRKITRRPEYFSCSC